MWVCTGGRKGERKYRNKRECGESKHEREKAPQREGLSSVGEWTWMWNYIPLSLCVWAYISALTPSSPAAIPSTTCNPTLHHSSPISPPSLAPSIPGGAVAWVAGGGRRRDLGAPSQEANRCSPSGVSQMAHIKKSWEGTEKDENIPQDEQATDSCKFLSFSVSCLKKYMFFFSFLLDLSTSCAPAFRDSRSLSDTSAPPRPGQLQLTEINVGAQMGEGGGVQSETSNQKIRNK